MTSQPPDEVPERGDSWIGRRIRTDAGEEGVVLDKAAVLPTLTKDELIDLIMAKSQQELVRWEENENLELVSDWYLADGSVYGDPELGGD